MGDKDEKAKWDRTSDVNALVKDVNNPVGCIQCHDPHAAKPRIIRDALIDAIERDGGARPYDADKGAAAGQRQGRQLPRRFPQDRPARQAQLDPAVRSVPCRVQLQRRLRAGEWRQGDDG